LNEVRVCAEWGPRAHRNVVGTGVDERNKERGSWIAHYRGYLAMHLRRPKKEVDDIIFDCSVGGCRNSGTHGGHVVFDKGSRGLYIIPLCVIHNPKADAKIDYYECSATYALKLYDMA
jgi:hypothetical protein